MVATLPPGETTFVCGTLQVTDGSFPAYSFIDIRAGVDLGSIHDFADPVTVQHRPFRIQLSDSYTYDPNAGVLLVCNNRTTREELAAWTEVRARRGGGVRGWGC